MLTLVAGGGSLFTDVNGLPDEEFLFMGSDLSSGITGQALDVNCGEYKA